MSNGGLTVYYGMSSTWVSAKISWPTEVRRQISREGKNPNQVTPSEDQR
jgi:hypothetical protein